LKVIPVVDVLNGVVVHAVRGNRALYQPLKSVLTFSVDPLEVATVFKLQGFSELYIADLDAIIGNKLSFELYQSFAQLDFNFMLDAGITDLEAVKKLQNSGASKFVIGTETLQNIAFVKEAVEQIGADNIVISIDLKDNQVLTHHNFVGSTDVFELLNAFYNMGVSKFILLDISRVGTNKGANTVLLKKIITLLDDIGIYIGGGVKGVDELLYLEKLNILGVLSATALHLGNISIPVLKKAGLL
jgi:phosphoribosylformimino-5-aminoimidazole carboxamide ribotide isomerase